MEKIYKSKILAVEGKDEVSFFSSLLDYLNIDDVQIFDFEGKYNFPKKLQTLVLSPNFDIVNSIGLVRDADKGSPDSAFQSLHNTISDLSFLPPLSIGAFSEDKPRFGVFIMPDNQRPGMLEDLCLDSLEGEDIMDCIDTFYECIPDKPENFNTAKSKALAFLATRHPLVNSLGIAAKKGFIDFNNKCFEQIKIFVGHL